MKLRDQNVTHIAKLARIELSENEIAPLRDDLNEILDYVAHLSELSLEDVPACSHVHGVVNAFRDDVVRSSLGREQIEQNAPAFSKGGFSVPKVI